MTASSHYGAQHDACCPEIEVRVRGDLDIATAPQLRERLADALSLKPNRLVVDLSGCTFFDATGITMLLDVHRQAWRQHAALVLSGCSSRQRRILALMGLKDVFTIVDAPGDLVVAVASGAIRRPGPRRVLCDDRPADTGSS